MNKNWRYTGSVLLLNNLNVLKKHVEDISVNEVRFFCCNLRS